jgi:hypothetical protein
VLDTPAARDTMRRARWAMPWAVVGERTTCAKAAGSVGASLMPQGD